MTYLIHFFTYLLVLVNVSFSLAKRPITRPSPAPTPTRQQCGGFRMSPLPCPGKQVCVDDPYVSGCGMACDAPGICVDRIFCGGIVPIRCNGKCIDDPTDDCDPKNGGADCGGICVPPPPKPTLVA